VLIIFILNIYVVESKSFENVFRKKNISLNKFMIIGIESTGDLLFVGLIVKNIY